MQDWLVLISSYLNVRYGLVWTDLRDLHVPLRVGDVVILPGTPSYPPTHMTLIISDWILTRSW
jgi:hypothetical protein